MKSIIKFWIPWVIGVIIAMFIISLWRNSETDWGFVVAMAIGGFIGMLISMGVQKIKKKSDNHI